MSDDIRQLSTIFGTKVEPILARKLAERGVKDVSELPREAAIEDFIDACTEAALVHFPNANHTKLRHGLQSFVDPIFSSAMKACAKLTAISKDAFDFCVGPDAAIVMAAYGIPIAPMDKRSGKILAPPSTNLVQVAAAFSKYKTAFAAYSPSEAQFYCLTTDSLSDLKNKVQGDPRLSALREVMERSKASLPVGNGKEFQHFSAVFARLPEDKFETVFLNDSRSDHGSIVFIAGYMDGEVREGAPNDGWLPVPMSLLRGAMADSELAFWLTEPVNSRSIVVH